MGWKSVTEFTSNRAWCSFQPGLTMQLASQPPFREKQLSYRTIPMRGTWPDHVNPVCFKFCAASLAEHSHTLQSYWQARQMAPGFAVSPCSDKTSQPLQPIVPSFQFLDMKRLRTQYSNSSCSLPAGDKDMFNKKVWNKWNP